eukprot:365630-Chlamydomonas_euryale.AAC.14
MHVGAAGWECGDSRVLAAGMHNTSGIHYMAACEKDAVVFCCHCHLCLTLPRLPVCSAWTGSDETLHGFRSAPLRCMPCKVLLLNRTTYLQHVASKQGPLHDSHSDPDDASICAQAMACECDLASYALMCRKPGPWTIADEAPLSLSTGT